MIDFIDGLEQDLVAAARRRAIAPRQATAWWRRVSRRGFLVAALVPVLTAGSAAAGTLYALRGSVIPAPEAVPPEQTPLPGTARLTSVRAHDPVAGRPVWTVRVARSTTGLLCSTVGQLVGGRFGLVGLDGRFRPIAPEVSDSCGLDRRDAASLIGARVFDAHRPADVRTVVSGVGGDRLRTVAVEAMGRTIAVPVAAGGVFAVALAGYPEDQGIRATLRFADGREERHDLGHSPGVVPDPAGGSAWKASAFMIAGDGRDCVVFRSVRETRAPPLSPSACGSLGTGVHWRGWFFAVRRITPGTGRVPIDIQGDGHWGDHPARTAVWGQVGEDVRAVSVQIAGERPQDVAIGPARTILAVFGPRISPRALTVRLRLRNGRLVVRHGTDGLVRHPLPAPGPAPMRRVP